MNLEEADKEMLIEFAEAIANLGRSVRCPMDPKVDALLEVIFNLIHEQIDLDKTYEYVGVADNDSKFEPLDQDIPDAKELESWMNDGLDDS
jgi:hypothetical protein